MKEYEMLRQEILQYLEEYQNVRNMMYLITVTLIGFCLTNADVIEYVYLLPLIVIIPSYLIYIDYSNNIIRDATYLSVFYEKDIEFPIKWESRLRKYVQLGKTKNYYHEIPYIACTLISILLYLFYMNKNMLNIIIGVVIFGVCLFVFIKNRKMTYAEAIEIWEKVKEQ